VSDNEGTGFSVRSLIVQLQNIPMDVG